MAQFWHDHQWSGYLILEDTARLVQFLLRRFVAFCFFPVLAGSTLARPCLHLSWVCHTRARHTKRKINKTLLPGVALSYGRTYHALVLMGIGFPHKSSRIVQLLQMLFVRDVFGGFFQVAGIVMSLGMCDWDSSQHSIFSLSGTYGNGARALDNHKLARKTQRIGKEHQRTKT
jgi:hypothetical protein